MADVSLRYSKDHAATQSRLARVIDINMAHQLCAAMTQHLRKGPFLQEERELWAERDRLEGVELRRATGQPNAPLPGMNSPCT